MRSSAKMPLVAIWAIALVACDFRPESAIPAEAAQRLTALEAERAQKPGDLQTLIHLGSVYEEVGHWFDAANVYKAASDVDPSSPDAHLGLFRAYYELGYTLSAFRELEQCVLKNPEHPECLYRDASFLLLNDNSQPGLQRARELFTRFVKVAPNHPNIPIVTQTLERLEESLGPASPGGEGAASQPATPASQPSAPPASSPPPSIAAHQESDGQPVGNLNAFGAAIGEAMKAAQQQDAPAAEAGFRKALAIQPDDAIAMGGLAEALFQQKKEAEAIEQIQKAYALDSEEPLVQWVYGLVMVRSGKNVAAGVGAWKRLASAHPDYAAQLGVDRLLQEVEKFQKPAPAPQSP